MDIKPVSTAPATSFSFTAALGAGFHSAVFYGGRAVTLAATATRFVVKDILGESFAELFSQGKQIFEAVTSEPQSQQESYRKRKRKVRSYEHQKTVKTNKSGVDVFMQIMQETTQHWADQFIPTPKKARRES